MAFTLIDEAADLASVAERWKHARYVDGRWQDGAFGSAQDIYERLSVLPRTATRDDVTAIIGNTMWVGDDCDECDGRAIVRIGDGIHGWYLCQSCISRLTQLVATSGDTHHGTH